MTENTMITAVKTALTSVSGDISTVLADVTPIALAIIGSVMVVTFGVKIFKKITGRA